MAAAVVAASAVVGATVAATVASTLGPESRPRGAVVAVAAGAGGLGGFLLWRLTRSAARRGLEGALEVAAAEERALRLVDRIHACQPRRFEDVLDEASYCAEVERWVLELRGGPIHVPPALRLAARAAHLERGAVSSEGFGEGRQGYLSWRAKARRRQGERLEEILLAVGVERGLVARACALVGKELPIQDVDMQTMEDAACLIFLGHRLCQFQADKDDGTMADILQKTWRKMSPQAQAKAVVLDYTPRMLGCLLEGAAAAADLQASVAPMVAPRLPAATVTLLRDSWALVPQDKFGDEFYGRLFAEDENLREVFDVPAARPQNIPKVVRMLLDLLDSEQVPRFERVIHAMAALSRHFARFRTSHLAAIKKALVRSITDYAPSKEKKKTSQAWEAFFYSVCAVSCPFLIMNDRLFESANSTASALPLPSGGTLAGNLASQGVALLEMCLRVSGLSQGGTAAPEEVLHRITEARDWLMDAVRDDVNAYCGLVSSFIAVTATPEEPSSANARVLQGGAVIAAAAGAAAEEAERRRWLRRSVEVPLYIAELSYGAAVACLQCRRQIKRSLQPEWVAGAKLMRTATEIALRNVSTNLLSIRGQGNSEALEKRFAKLRDTEPPWEDLCNFGIN
mmetsp:Transcript_147082/g.472417  ORF Transcript_147082/g.472417 Transcript_147082/m.472417 type:complete len:628 (-) Transcript_147082:106-1989(-)